MTAQQPVPEHPKIYHITHVGNLTGIVAERAIWSDRERINRGLTSALVGMGKIKQRRLDELIVKCHPPTKVGDYVPFYFCPRSIMLYILWKGNHSEVTYRGGQEPIVHLVGDLRRVVAWASAAGRRWAFSDCNAGATYAEFYADLGGLDRVNWDAVDNHDFRSPTVKDGKQAEFLLYESFPWTLVDQIGVQNETGRTQVLRAIEAASHQPPIDVKPEWYYP